MVTTTISISKTISNIKTIVDLTLLNPTNFDQMKMSSIIHQTQENITICIPLESDYYWLKVIQFVRQKSQKWEVKLSDDFISNELKQLIFQLKINRKKYGEIGKSVKQWIEKLKQTPVTNFRYILPLNNVDYRKDFDFGKVKLQKLNLIKIKKLAHFANNGIFSAKKILEDMISSNCTEIFVVLEVQAKDEKQGMELAQFNLKRLIHAMRLFDPPSGVTEREHHFPETHHHYIVVNLDHNSYSTRWSNLHLNSHIWRTKEYWRRVNPDWKTLTNFLFSNNLNEIQSLILTGLYWYGDAGKETEDKLSKFLKYTYGLENLLIFDNKPDKGKRTSERLAKIFSRNNSTNFNFYKDLMIQYYNVRSRAIHSGKLIVDAEDIGTTHNWLRNLLFEYIRLSKKYTEIKTMFKKEFSIGI